MVDVTPKGETAREAVACAILRMRPRTLSAIKAGQVAKGDVLGVARTAGIMAAKKTSELIPLCHPLRITGVDLSFKINQRSRTLT
ncbi:MAG: cyclic pyranopterin monophosphate synthase MoaC, partial [candidate division NC10 bacterium]